MYKRMREVEHGRSAVLPAGGSPKSLLQLKVLLRECFGELEADKALCECFTTPRLYSDNPRAIMENLYTDIKTEADLHYDMLLNLLYEIKDDSRPLLIMGTVGVGKSTLVRHLLKCSNKLNNPLLPVFVDFKKANSQISDLSSFVNEEIDTALTIALPSELDDTYVTDVLFSYDPTAKHRIANLSELDPHEGRIALKRLLLHSREDLLQWNRSRIHYIQKVLGRSVFLVFDNLDHHLSPVFISRVLTEGRRQSSTNKCRLIITLRPQNLGLAFGAYAAEPLPLARVDGVEVREMLQRRINMVTARYPALPLDSIVLSNGMRVRPDDYLKLLVMRFELFLSDQVISLIDGIVGRNYRKLLLGMRQVFTSKLLTQAEDIGRSDLTKYDVLEALLRPTGGLYLSPETDPDALLVNVFENEQPEQYNNNLIRIRVLQVLAHGGQKALHRQVLKDLESIGYTNEAAEAVLDLLHAHGLIEGGDHSEVLSSIDSYVYCYRLTESGSYYLSNLIYEFRYILAVREDILFPENVYATICGGNVTSEDRLTERMRVVFAFDDYINKLEDAEERRFPHTAQIREIVPRIALAMKQSHQIAFDNLKGAAMRREQIRDSEA